MKKNMGTLDRVLRTITALAVLWFYYMGMISGLTAIILFVVAGIFLLTSIVGTCPLYMLLGVNTCSAKTKVNQQG